ncbi:pilus assembly protein TadG-related protein [Bradyrhizobium sp.]|uniref:TadE/TadG family type IV pilus assembly protein n=1 Tax=Bradyrhizobium sp. TaxID=376 RepID=UPI0026212980|nr:pilus assembly protein TadG-related protein [Bradyrhizobium sp.]
MLRAWLYCFAGNRKANVAVIFALTIVPIIFLLGMTLDFSQALRKKEQLDAAADAAAIAAVRPAMLMQSDTVASDTAMAIFMSVANSLPGLAATPTPTITVTDTGLQRTVSVSYNAASLNNFPKVLLNTASWPISGSATSQAAAAPNMNFYLLMDDSPSMAIGATTTDISNLIAATASQPGGSKSCGFACHETNIAADGGGATRDNLSVARANNITLRIDLVTDAVNQLLNTWSNCPQTGISGGVMQCMSALNNTTYKAALYTFDLGLNTLQTLSTPTTAGTKVSNIQLMAVDHHNCVFSGCSSSSPTNPTTDHGTNIAGALSTLNSSMPTPGLGSNSAGDTPQEVVFLVTDGVEDKIVSGASACPNASLAGSKRCQQPLDTTACTAIKNRGIKIAILYTEYLQLKTPNVPVTDNWYMTWVDPYDTPTSSSGTIATNLKACASPGFFSDVTTGGNITQALTDLFIKVASSTASLTQ